MPETAYVWRASADEPWTLLAGNIVVPGLGPDGDSLTLVDAHAHVAGWSVDERAERGVAAIDVPDRPSDPALVVTGHIIEEVDGLPVWTWTTEPKGLEQVKAERAAQVEQQYAARMLAGFPVAAYPGETLQVRSAEDNARWLGLKDACDEKVDANEGDQPMARPPRSTSNANLPMTYAEGRALLVALRDWAGDLLDHRWALKDAIRDAETVEAVLAVDPATGWEA